MSGDRTPKVFLSSKHSELNGTFSPDGRWVAYQSDASGRYEVVVRPFPNKDPAQTISRDGGMYPRWRGDGKELFFLSPDGTMMAAGFDATIGLPRVCLKCCFGNRSGSSATTVLTQSTGTASAFLFRSLPIHESPPSWIGGRYSPGEQRGYGFRRRNRDLRSPSRGRLTTIIVCSYDASALGGSLVAVLGPDEAARVPRCPGSLEKSAGVHATPPAGFASHARGHRFESYSAHYPNSSDQSKVSDAA